MRLTDQIKTCPCGGTWHDAENNPDGTITMVRHKREPGYWVVCTRCGRTGMRGRTQVEAVTRWNGRCYKYGPLEDEA